MAGTAQRPAVAAPRPGRAADPAPETGVRVREGRWSGVMRAGLSGLGETDRRNQGDAGLAARIGNLWLNQSLRLPARARRSPPPGRLAGRPLGRHKRTAPR
ncbi:hypothetical protein GCM10023088_66260 [Actinomadura verrucosospora]